jgi:hypothetical protein
VGWFPVSVSGCPAAARFALWALDTQFIESVNSSIRQIITAAPHINLELLSARTVIRRSFPRLDLEDALAEAVQPPPQGCPDPVFPMSTHRRFQSYSGGGCVSASIQASQGGSPTGQAFDSRRHGAARIPCRHE